MKKRSASLGKYFILPFLLVIPVVLGTLIFLNSKDSATNNAQEKPTYQTQTDSQGEVTIDATPITLRGGQQATFELVFTTHSVDLNYELAQISKLQDDLGKSYDALSWDGGKGGHHLSGKLIFPKISDQAKSVTLTIPNIDNQDRIFSWNLQ